MSHPIRSACVALGAAVILAQAVFAEGSPQTSVEFAPAVTAHLQRDFGVSEAGVLRSAIVAALAKAERHEALPEGLTLKVTVRELLPTHPTMKQQLDNPSLSPARTRYLGGADLVGELRDSKQQVLLSVDYRNFADVPGGRLTLFGSLGGRAPVNRCIRRKIRRLLGQAPQELSVEPDRSACQTLSCKLHATEFAPRLVDPVGIPAGSRSPLSVLAMQRS